MRLIHWIALVLASLTPIGAFAQCVQAPEANTWKTLLPTTAGCGKLAKPYRYLQAQKSNHKIGINGVCTPVMFKNESTNVQCLNGQPTLIGWKSSEERLRPFTRDDFDRMKTVEVANSYVKNTTGESVLTQTRETTRESKYKLNPMGDYDLSIPGNPFITTTIKTIGFKGNQKTYTLKINDKVTRACSVTTAPDGKKSFIEMTPKDCQNEGLQSFWGTIIGPTKLTPVELSLKQTVFLPKDLPPIPIATGNIVEIIGRYFNKQKTSASLVSANSAAETSESEEPVEIPGVPKDSPLNRLLNGYPQTLFPCDPSKPVINQSTQEYDCPGGKIYRPLTRIESRYKLVLDGLSGDDINSIRGTLKSQGLLPEDITGDDDLQRRLRGMCMLSRVEYQYTDFECSVRQAGGGRGVDPTHYMNARVSYYFGKDLKKRGQQSRIVFGLDNANYYYGKIANRTYTAMSLAEGVASSFQRKYEGQFDLVDCDRLDDNRECVQPLSWPPPAMDELPNCKFLPKMERWSIGSGIPSIPSAFDPNPDSDVLSQFELPVNKILTVAREYNGCTLKNLYPWGDTANTAQWFHTDVSGNNLWAETPLDANWNSTYILTQDELARWITGMPK